MADFINSIYRQEIIVSNIDIQNSVEYHLIPGNDIKDMIE